MADDSWAPANLNTDVAHPARVYDYWLGGKDNFAADREVAEKLIAAMPGTPESARANRGFLKRAVRLVAESGVRQFLDIGSGLPTVENTHEIAHQVAPDARVVYVDNDPIVLAHGRALLGGTDSTTVIQADLKEPEQILADPDVRRLIDFGQPLCVLLLAVLHFVSADDHAYRIVERLRTTMAPGSFLVLSHLTADSDPEGIDRFLNVLRQSPGTDVSVPRTRDRVERFFDGFTILEPGIVPVHRWGSGNVAAGERFWLWAGVGRKD